MKMNKQSYQEEFDMNTSFISTQQIKDLINEQKFKGFLTTTKPNTTIRTLSSPAAYSSSHTKPKINLLLFNPPSRSAPYVYSTRPLRFDPVAACHSLRPKSLIEEFHPHYQNQSDNNGAKKFPYVPEIR